MSKVDQSYLPIHEVPPLQYPKRSIILIAYAQKTPIKVNLAYQAELEIYNLV